MPQLDPVGFTANEEANDGDVHQRHLVQIEHEPRLVPSDFGAQLVQVLRADAPMSRSVAV